MGLFNSLFGQDSLDLVTRKNAIEPYSDISKSKFTFEFYLNYRGGLCIIGYLDNYYVCNMSYSTVEDVERTQRIIDDFRASPHKTVTTLHNILGGRGRQELETGRFKTKITTYVDKHGITHYSCAGSEYYSDESFLARQLRHSWENLQRKCRFRIIDGAYLSVLKIYHEILSKYKRGEKEAPGYYSRHKLLIRIIEEESYLKLSQDAEVRQLYTAVSSCAEDLYGAYMDEAR